MTSKQYKQLKERVTAEYDLAIREAKSALDSDMRALDKVFELFKKSVQNRETHKSVSPAIKRVFLSGKLPDRFTKNDIVRLLDFSASLHSVHKALERFVRQNILVIAEKGAGRTPHTYKLNPTDNEATDAQP